MSMTGYFLLYDIYLEPKDITKIKIKIIKTTGPRQNLCLGFLVSLPNTHTHTLNLFRNTLKMQFMHTLKCCSTLFYSPVPHIHIM